MVLAGPQALSLWPPSTPPMTVPPLPAPPGDRLTKPPRTACRCHSGPTGSAERIQALQSANHTAGFTTSCCGSWASCMDSLSPSFLLCNMKTLGHLSPRYSKQSCTPMGHASAQPCWCVKISVVSAESRPVTAFQGAAPLMLLPREMCQINTLLLTPVGHLVPGAPSHQKARAFCFSNGLPTKSAASALVWECEPFPGNTVIKKKKKKKAPVERASLECGQDHCLLEGGWGPEPQMPALNSARAHPAKSGLSVGTILASTDSRAPWLPL